MEKNNGTRLELGKYQQAVSKRLKNLDDEKFPERLWKKDTTLWNTIPGEELMLGWLDSAEKMMKEIPGIQEFVSEVQNSGFNHVVLLGMGGSSLSSFVMKDLFKNENSKLRFSILDTTEPESIRKIRAEMNIATLFLVSSKSGSTAEVAALRNYFFSGMTELKGSKAGENFVAITDPGSSLEKLAGENNYRKTFLNPPDIGGRFSVLSLFGLVPAALMGVDINKLMERSNEMIRSCGPSVKPADNPGMVIGATIAELALSGRDKLTFIAQPGLESFGLWLEQLLAESTGKNEKGIFPVVADPLFELELYGKDTAFFQLCYPGASKELRKIALHYPFISIEMADPYDIGQEFFRWEIATATAGAIFGINPFDQENVEESKKCTREILNEVSSTGKLPQAEIALVQNGIRYYSYQKAGNAKLLLENFFDPSRQKDFIVLQCYLPETMEIKNTLQRISYSLRRKLKIAVSVQFGPRYLHSTGQYHKGGPNNGYFVQFISSSEDEINIPGHDYSFGLLKKAQAFGDREALIKLNRNVILVDLSKSPAANLETFEDVISKIQSLDDRRKKNIYAYNNEARIFEVTPGLLVEENQLLAEKNTGINP